MPRVLDAACNDGALAANLWAWGGITVDGIDLNPACVERARGRGVPGRFEIGKAEDAFEALEVERRGRYGVVVAFELVEHVADPAELLQALARCCKPNGRLFVSTPLGAVEQGALPEAAWRRVEPKGHVRAYTLEGFRRELEAVGTVEALEVGADLVQVARVRVI